MDVLDHIRECVTGESAASCINLNFAIPDNKFDDLRQPIPGRGFLQYGFAQEIKKEPKNNNLVQVWKPMDAIVDMNSANHGNFILDVITLNKIYTASYLSLYREPFRGRGAQPTETERCSTNRDGSVFQADWRDRKSSLGKEFSLQQAQD